MCDRISCGLIGAMRAIWISRKKRSTWNSRGVAHAAMRQDRALAGAVPGLGGEVFGGVGIGADRGGIVAAVIGGGGAQHQQFGGFEFDPALGERVLDALVLADRPAEHDALAGIARGAGQRGAAEPDRLGGDQDALRVHAVQDVLKALIPPRRCGPPAAP